MNRNHAEHILDAYVETKKLGKKYEAAANSLREVIVDAMTEYRTFPYYYTTSGTGITVSNSPKTSDPLKWNYVSGSGTAETTIN